jgi:hypothetical protein
MKTKDIFFYALGALIVIGFFVVLVVLMYTSKSPESINMTLGALLAAFGTVVGYFYGSSKGSADKNDLINKNPNEKF